MGQFNADNGIHSSLVLAAANRLWNTLNAVLSSSPRWSPSIEKRFTQRWGYAVSIMVGAYEDGFKEAMFQRNTDLEQTLDRLRERTQEVKSLNHMVQQLIQIAPLSEPTKRDAEGLISDIEKLLEWME
ncbi:MAG: hypothetical protein V3U90_00725 [Dehalococcoidia bacterium]